MLLRPAIAALRRAGDEIWLLAPGHGAFLSDDGMRLVDGFLDFEAAAFAAALSDPTRLPAGWPDFARAFVVSSRPDVLAAVQAGARRILACKPTPDAGVHASDWYAAALCDWNVAPIQTADAGVPFAPKSKARTAADPFLERLGEEFVAIHPGSGSANKNWPAERFAELARLLSNDKRWLLLEGPADRDAAALLRGVPGAVEARDLPLGVVATLLSHAGLYVGNDSGISHLAAAVGTSSVVLFGPTDPAVWAPRGRRTRVLRAEGGDLRRLAVPPVAAVARGLLSRGRHT